MNSLFAWDDGNGQSKGVLLLPESEPVTVKIPNGYSLEQPLGVLDQENLKRKKPKAFYLEVGGRKHYFGRDVLSNGVIRKIDTAKYDPDYMRLMFSATMAELIRTKKIDPQTLGTITVSAGMPAEMYQDDRQRVMVEKAYKKVFKAHKAPWNVKGEGFKTFGLVTRFGTVYPEATTVAASVDARGFDLVLVGDFGYGTNDWVLYDPIKGRVLKVSTLNNGLTSFFFKQVRESETEVEWEYMTGQGDEKLLETHFSRAELNMANVIRSIKGKRIKLVLIGGTKLMPDDWKQKLRATYIPLFGQRSVVFRDEFANALAFGGALNG